ncbi:DUF2797 domain-containing protein [Tumebacillus permanentifrigoris]|uniref:Uncharacterized protein DUF2797 n=1 Tax=Tumebacillus permanentifrigoris TaxID=378543 RepID=A0A316DBC9_9BACL|nr:DUF2797 domain-containing protein [Tumebacillus permanentifrigoris]PWK14392.1 uncharacterized protein DUF2797 [Tumebacillus permanentifrigoris]
MTTYQGFLSELRHQPESPVAYFLKVGEQTVALNELIGTKLTLTFLEEKACCSCGRKVKGKLYGGGYCYPCVTTLAECDLCIMKPHECHFDKGTCRDEAFAQTHCMIPHYVYLALSSNVKVGLTRKHRELTRWVDQGAIRAIPIAELPTRKMAGELEMIIAEHIADKTDWRKMLKGVFEEADLFDVRAQMKAIVPEEFQQYLFDVDQLFEFTYPILETLEKVKSIGFDKEPTIEGKLIGIKGQYLIFDIGVLNIKKHSGYKVEVTTNAAVEQTA